MAGVPFLLKDLMVDYAGVPTSKGCRFCQDAVADHEASSLPSLDEAALQKSGQTDVGQQLVLAEVEARRRGADGDVQP